VHHNAEALRRLVSWAETGVENRMYAGPEQRAAEIEAGAALPAATLRALVAHSADRLAADFDALPAEAWSHQVVTAQGRTVLAVEIPWMRAREVAVHAVDLDAGVGFADLPNDLTAALVADAVAKQNAQGNLPGLAAWLTGRTAEAPPLGRWL
jgi:maleylpyruvate isomerase